MQLKPDRLMVGIYIGNDFMDLIRQDDRPYLTREADGSVKAHPPDFMMYEDPDAEPGMLASTRMVSLTKQALGPTFLYQTRRANAVARRRQRSRNGFDVVRYMWRLKN